MVAGKLLLVVGLALLFFTGYQAMTCENNCAFLYHRLLRPSRWVPPPPLPPVPTITAPVLA